jgi:nucleotide-binding universal stress UspA family protein
MLYHILVPLDGSQLAEQALEYAQSIVSSDGRITLLTVVEIAQLPLPEPAVQSIGAVAILANPWAPTPHERQQAVLIQAQTISDAENYLQQVASRLRTSTLRVETSVQSRVQPAEAIVQTAAGLYVDAIVMATHGRSGLSRWLMGSVTHKVLNAPPCPVFVVPSNQRD